VRLGFYQEKVLWVIVCAALFSLTHLANAWLFQFFSVSPNISWIYLPAFLRLIYVLVLGPWWGFITIFLGGLPLMGMLEGSLSQVLLNVVCSALSPVLALGLFKLLKQRDLVLNRLRDLIELCLLYALLNAVLHHFSWALQQPDQLLTVTQLPIMVVGDLLGAVVGAYLFSRLIRRLGLYKKLERLSQTKPTDPS
jgi:hypothetical protein